MNVQHHKETIITDVLNKGDGRDLEWLCKTYTLEEIKAVVSSPQRGMWIPEVLAYWLKIFDLKLPENVLKKSVINPNP